MKTAQQRRWNGRYFEIWHYRYLNKNRGYHLEHNFGHVFINAQSSSFPVPYRLHWVDERYQRARAQRGTRKGFFQDLVSLTKYLLFEGWQHLLDFILDDAVPLRAPNTS